MLKQLYKIVKDTNFILSFFVPIIIAFSAYEYANKILGVSENRLKIDGIVINYISEDSIAIPILGIQVTVFVLFFAFAQYSLSSREINSNIIRKYILKDKKTLQLIAFQLSFSLILSFFSYCEKLNIVEKAIVLIIIPLSLFQLMIYFYWVVQTMNPKELFEMVLERFIKENIEKNIKHLNRKRKKINKSINTFNKKNLCFSVRIIKDNEDKTKDDKDNIVIVTTKLGLVTGVDIKKIVKIIKVHRHDVAEIIICKKIGEQLSNDNLVLKIILRSGTDKVVFQQNIKEKLTGCFNIKPENELNEENYNAIRDLVFFLSKAISYNSDNTKEIIQYFINSLDGQFEQNHENLSLLEHIYSLLIRSINEKFYDIQVDILDFNAIEHLTYFIAKNAYKYNSVKILEVLLQFHEDLFTDLIINTEKNANHITIIIDRIQNSYLENMIDAFENGSTKTLSEQWSSDYIQFIEEILKMCAAMLQLMILSFYKRNPEDNRIILIQNAAAYLNIFKNLSCSKLIDELRIKKNGELKKIDALFVSYTFMFTIIVFKNVEEKKYPKWLLFDLAFPLCINCRTLLNNEKDKDIFIIDYFMNPTITHGHIYSEGLIINKIHRTGGDVQEFYNGNKFFLSLLFWWNKSQKIDNLTASIDSYLKKNPKENENLQNEISKFLKFLKNNKHFYLLTLFEIEKYELIKFIKFLDKKIKDLIKNNFL